MSVDIANYWGAYSRGGGSIKDLLLESVVLFSILQPLFELPAFLQPGEHLVLFTRRLLDLRCCAAHHPGTSHDRKDGEALCDYTSTQPVVHILGLPFPQLVRGHQKREGCDQGTYRESGLRIRFPGRS